MGGGPLCLRFCVLDVYEQFMLFNSVFFKLALILESSE